MTLSCIETRYIETRCIEARCIEARHKALRGISSVKASEKIQVSVSLSFEILRNLSLRETYHYRLWGSVCVCIQYACIMHVALSSRAQAVSRGLGVDQWLALVDILIWRVVCHIHTHLAGPEHASRVWNGLSVLTMHHALRHATPRRAASTHVGKRSSDATQSSVGCIAWQHATETANACRINARW